ncbi:hypothetical protein BD414DRAFT_512887 [Trametes punicea]|nr:hypothetical protein BD414DRAFT_512887 [Trametes punicea]
MDIARARSPPATLGRRPIGPRSPIKSGSAPKNIIPLDLSARLHEDIASIRSPPDPTALSNSPAASPALNGLPGRPAAPQPQSAQVNGYHERTISQGSSVSADAQPELEAKPEPALEEPLRRRAKSPVHAAFASSPPPFNPAGKDADPLGPPAEADYPPSPAPLTLPLAPPLELEPAPPMPTAAPAYGGHVDQSVSDSRPDSAQGGAHPGRTFFEKSVQAQPAQPADPTSTPGSTRAPTPATLVRAAMLPKRPPLAPPPPLSLEAEPIAWKGLTLDAAQWTFTSEQLQETVSRAIRQSASESFIRVVPMHTLDVELPEELERLDQLKATTQAQYKFNMSRRTMLLQSLAALSHTQYTDGSDGEALYNLTSQLADLTVSCDRLVETLVRISDQRAQIQHVQDLHIASALSMALRKLNTSYAKRTTELQEARTRNQELEAELQEAWSMAQEMAQEMDDLDNFELTFSDEELELGPEFQHDPDALEAEIYNDMDRMSASASVRNAEVVEITGTAVATKATLTTFPSGQKPGERTSRVVAAKKRSSRASKASLRMPKTPTKERGDRPDRASIYSIHSRSRSKSIRRRSERAEAVSPASEEVPQVPVIHVSNPSPHKEGSFLELSETRPVSPSVSVMSEPPPMPPPVISEPSPSPPPLLEKGDNQVQEEPQRQITACKSLPRPHPDSHLLWIPHIAPAEEVPPEPSIPNPPPSPTFHTMNIPTISLQEAPKSSSSGSWRPRRFFSRRVQSMQPPLRVADDAPAPSLKRSISEFKQFDGWPFLGGGGGAPKAQRFSVPVLSVIQPLKRRSSTDSAPAASSSRLSSTSSK